MVQKAPYKIQQEDRSRLRERHDKNHSAEENTAGSAKRDTNLESPNDYNDFCAKYPNDPYCSLFSTMKP
jgi:hypothetical protein